MLTFSDRIGGDAFLSDNKEYKFAKIRRIVHEAKAVHPDKNLIDLGVGEPDEPPCDEILSHLQSLILHPDLHGYSDNGPHDFLQAVVRHMQQIYGVEIHPSEALHCLGAKSALSLLPKCFFNPGDTVLTTTPGYPVFETQARYLGANVHHLPLTAENDFLPDLDKAPKNAKVLLLNYPNNPTGACATKSFFQKAVAWAKGNHVILINDAAYALLRFDGEKPFSLLSIPGAKDVSIEIHSLSKSFNMTGWRIGWVCGNKDLIKAYAHVKSNSDSGQFLPIQLTAAYALDHVDLAQATLDKYQRRLNKLTALFNELGFSCPQPQGTFFLYIKSPKSASSGDQTFTFPSAEAFSHFLIKEAFISTVPWDDVGSFVRVSATFSADSIDQEDAVYQEIKLRLGRFQFTF